MVEYLVEGGIVIGECFLNNELCIFVILWFCCKFFVCYYGEFGVYGWMKMYIVKLFCIDMIYYDLCF